MNKVIIAGCRHFQNYNFVKFYLDFILKNLDNVIIFSGGATGIDFLGERYAKENNLPIKKFPALWNKYGNAAGPIRNQEMAEEATHLIAFLSINSKGTKDMLKRAKDKDLKIREILI